MFPGSIESIHIWQRQWWYFDTNVFRDAELDDDSELFVGPPPPALVSEAESANEAERFEEVFNPNSR